VVARAGLSAPEQGGTLRPHGCFIAFIALLSPRLALFLIWILSDLLSRAYSSWILPLLGFFLLPSTTLAYAAFWDWATRAPPDLEMDLRGAGLPDRHQLGRRRTTPQSARG